MSASPAFASTPRTGLAAITAANTARDGSGTLVDLLTGVTAGTRVDRVVFKSTGQPANSVILVWYFDGTTNWLYDEIVISGTPAAGSTTAAAYRIERKYEDLVLAGSTHKLRVTATVVPTSGQINAEAFGGDLT